MLSQAIGAVVLTHRKIVRQGNGNRDILAYDPPQFRRDEQSRLGD